MKSTKILWSDSKNIFNITRKNVLRKRTSDKVNVMGKPMTAGVNKLKEDDKI